jgi:hypothetical protein
MALKTKLLKHLLLFLPAILYLSSCKKEIQLAPVQPAQTSKKALNSQPLVESQFLAKLDSKSDLKLGINGHLGDAPYLKVPWIKQIEIIKQRGISYYRVNVQTKSNGSAASSVHLEALLSAASVAGVKILPMLYLSRLNYENSEIQNYKFGKELGERFAAKYGKYFEFYNLGNDEELPLKYKNKTGIKPEHYDLEKFKATASFLKGMDEGIKENDANAKTIIGAGWLHFGFLQMCNSYGIKFDRIGYNWYSDMENAAPKAPYFITDITQTLATLFPTQPIWFLEYNYRYKAKSFTNEVDQDIFVKNFTAKCRANPNVKVAIVYQLFDEPYKHTHEASYGIIKWKTEYSEWVDKLLSKSFLLEFLRKPKGM